MWNKDYTVDISAKPGVKGTKVSIVQIMIAMK